MRTTAINGNGQQHFQGDIRDDQLPLSLPFPFTPQEKADSTDPPSILSVGYIQVLRPRPAAGLQVQRESTAILSLQEAMDFVNTLHPGGDVFSFLLYLMNLTVSVSFYFYLYLLFIRAAGLQVQRESTAILSLQEALRRHSHYLYLFML